MKKSLIVFFTLLISLSSCSIYTFHYATGATAFPETIPASIKIYSEDVDREYIVIASVAANVNGEARTAITYLQKNAAKLGADAIIKLKLTKLYSYSKNIGASGVAIKFK